MAPPTSRPYEVIVWGATGFTGRLVAEHIAQNYQSGNQPLKWALAGRDAARLAAVKESLIAINSDCKAVPVLTADIKDAASLDRLLGSTKVVLAVAGPFALYGGPIIAAAVRQGTHYLDITGETLWVKKQIELYNEEAERKGVKIVPMCGYESLPADLLTLYAVDHIKQKYGKATGRVLQAFELVEDPTLRMSGGTAATMLNIFNTTTPKEKAAMMDPFLLCPPAGRRRSVIPPGPILLGYDKELGKWLCPSLLGTANEQVVRRSASLRSYGEAFAYKEFRAFNTFLQALSATLVLLALTACLGLAPLRWLLARFLPKPGQGPTRQQMMNTPWKQSVVAMPPPPEGASGTTPRQLVVGSVSGKCDMGYYMTARMILEGGIQLARHSDESEASGCAKGGVLTPATAMGLPLVARLQQAGFHFAIES